MNNFEVNFFVEDMKGEGKDVILFTNSYDPVYVDKFKNSKKLSIITKNFDILRRAKENKEKSVSKKIIGNSKNIVVVICIPKLFDPKVGINEFLGYCFEEINRLKNLCENSNITFNEVFIIGPGRVSEEEKQSISDYFQALSIKDLRKRYEFIYDKSCDIMDEKFKENNYCDFINDMCIRQRDTTARKSAHSDMGCCYMVEYTKVMEEPIDLGLCRNFECGKCNVRCLGCKLFTCKYLKKRGIKFTANDILLLRVFLNSRQKKYINETCFTSKDIIIEKLLGL